MLFTSDVDARTAFFEFWSRVQACDTDSGTDSAGDDMTSSWDTGWFAERGPYAVVRETFPNDAVAFYHLALQGNSVSVIRTDTLLSPGANVAAAVQTASEQGARAAAGLAEQLCMFRSQGCGKNLDLPFWLLYPGISLEGYLQQQLDQRQDER